MSIFNGKQTKGAMRVHREELRKDAEARQVDYNDDVAREMKVQDVAFAAAKKIVDARRRVSR